MGVNGYIGQLTLKYNYDINIMEQIKEQANFDDDAAYVSKLGIYSAPGNIFFINGEKYEIGKTGMYEARDVEIRSLSIPPQTALTDSEMVRLDFFTFVDFIYESTK